MVNELTRNIIISLVAIFVIILVNILIKSLIKRKVENKEAKEKRANLIRKIINYSSLIIIILSLISIWGFNLDNIWIYITSVLTLIAIGFIAVWSILSNLLAGVLLFFTGTVKIGDKITIITDKILPIQETISGKVRHISTLFVELQDEESNIIYVPNNLFFQRIIKKSK